MLQVNHKICKNVLLQIYTMTLFVLRKTDNDACITKHVTFHPFSNKFWDLFLQIWTFKHKLNIWWFIIIKSIECEWYFSVFLQKDIFEEFEIFRLILMHFKCGLNFPLLPDAWVGLFHERVLGYLHPAVILFTTFWFLFTRFSMSIAQYPTLSYLFFMYHNYLCFLRIVAIKEIKLPLQSQDQNVFPTAICNLIGRKNNLMSEKRSSFPLPDKLSLRVT